MAKLSELRKQAKDMGITAAVIRRATTASELQAVINDRNSDNGKPRKKGAVKKAVKKAVAKKGATKKAKTTAKNSGRKASTPAKSKGAKKAKRSSNSNGSGYVPKGGRNTLDRVNYSKTDGWNPREGSAPDRITKALKRFKGDRAKVFNHLKGDVWDFVAKKKTNGEKRSKQEALDMLKYRISRTAWDFAMRTGQHEVADNRVEYGTGGTGAGTFKRAKKSTARKSAQKASKATAKRGRPKGSKNAPKAQKASRGRAAAPKRGRPKGSKNKVKAGSRR